MRDAFCQAMLGLPVNDLVFLTGDLGFMALEPLRDRLGPHFINAGLAEQNMMSVAAGLVKTGLNTWVYSIAPFCFARCFEQIRNDVCLHKLPVHLVGNGGGYGYGVMGASHHALEDYGSLLTLQSMRVFVPAFDGDLEPVVQRTWASPSPTYLRLGRDECPKRLPLPAYDVWRRIMPGGDGPVIVYVGPLAGQHAGAFLELDEAVRPDVWVLGELPLLAETVPEQFAASVAQRRRLWVVEEHVEHGGLGPSLATLALRLCLGVREFRHYHARGYVSGRSGSQQFYRRESGIDAQTLKNDVAADATFVSR